MRGCGTLTHSGSSGVAGVIRERSGSVSHEKVTRALLDTYHHGSFYTAPRTIKHSQRYEGCRQHHGEIKVEQVSVRV